MDRIVVVFWNVNETQGWGASPSSASPQWHLPERSLCRNSRRISSLLLPFLSEAACANPNWNMRLDSLLNQGIIISTLFCSPPPPSHCLIIILCHNEIHEAATTKELMEENRSSSDGIDLHTNEDYDVINIQKHSNIQIPLKWAMVGHY